MMFRKVMMGFLACLLSSLCFAGGLDSATDALSEIKTWLFGFVGLSALVYLLYMVLMAFLERKSWSEVALALVYCAIAGGAVVGGTWALGLFK